MSLLQNDHKERSFDEDWALVKPVVRRLLNQTTVSHREWHDLFTRVYNIRSWTTDGSTLIRCSLVQEIESYVTKARCRIIKHTDEFEILRAYIDEWNRYFHQADILPLPFAIIDKDKDDKQDEPRLSIREDAMLHVWRTSIFEQFSDRLLSASMKLIENERNGQVFDEELVVGVRQSYVELYRDQAEGLSSEADHYAVYKNTFLKNYLDNTAEYYQSRCSMYLQGHGVIEYMFYADEKLREEEARARKYLDSGADSMNQLIETCVKVLVMNYEGQMLSRCPSLISSNDVEKLRMVYRLLKLTPQGMNCICNYIKDHIRTKGVNDMKMSAETITTDPEKYVSKLLEMFEQFSTLVKEGFYDDSRLLTARDMAFREVVNDVSVFKMELPGAKKGRNVPESKCPELLANYCDLLLRKTNLSKKLSSEEVEEKLNSLLLVLKYVTNKDVFMRFHKAHLCRRLILDVSADQDKEEVMVNNLRELGMPADHVNKLSRMLQDIELNKDMNCGFKKSLVGINNNRPMSELINVKILNGGAWGRGGSERMRVSLPKEIEDFVPEIENFYKKQHNGRKLMWMHHWSSGTMTFGTDNGGKYEIEATTFQMTVLFQWNERKDEKMSFESLRLATELPDTELARTLFSLTSCPKLTSQILLCDVPQLTSQRDFSDSTTFWLNKQFHLVKNGKVLTRGRVNLIGRLQLSMEPTACKEHEDIVALREFRVQEAIVKIMKSRKILNLAQLQTELVEVLKPMFLPNKTLIKEQIDWLIDNRFIERKSDDMNSFIYVS